MTDNSPRPGAVAVVTVEPDLALHIIDLLDAADVLTWGAPAGPLTEVMVPAGELDHARATIELVLPGLLAEESGELLPDDPPAERLSQRLIRRSDWTSESPAPDAAPPPGWRLHDGQQAFADYLLGDSLAGALAPDEDDPEDDYLPPEPPPLPRGDTVARFAWLGAIGGPILLIISGLLQLPTFVNVIALAGFVIGFGVLVARMPDRSPHDDDPGGGAVV